MSMLKVCGDFRVVFLIGHLYLKNKHHKDMLKKDHKVSSYCMNESTPNNDHNWENMFT